MKAWIIIAIYWVIAIAAIYANRAYNRKKNHHVSIVEWKIVGLKTSKWRLICYHIFTIIIEPLLLPVGIPVFLIHRIKERKENEKFDKLVISKERDLKKDFYYKASIVLVNALAYGKFKQLEKMLDDYVLIIQEDDKTIKGKSAVMMFWRDWKTKHIDTIDFDAFDRIFNDADFEVVQSEECSHPCVKLMMTQQIITFEIKDRQIVKMCLAPLGYNI